ncbi:MAG: putative molybdenum carrier protein [Pirellulales bacterium]|nr:putative molybdenum carrier protein [Pirellulales bacterium]
MKIISGGQTGVDRGALNAARALKIPHGGWCPKGRLTEDGAIPKRYRLRETDSADYTDRTERNVLDADATLILCRGPLTGGTRLTQRLCEEHQKSHRVVDLTRPPSKKNVLDWLQENGVEVLNVAGPRESQCPGIQDECQEFLVALFGEGTGGGSEVSD